MSLKAEVGYTMRSISQSHSSFFLEDHKILTHKLVFHQQTSKKRKGNMSLNSRTALQSTHEEESTQMNRFFLINNFHMYNVIYVKFKGGPIFDNLIVFLKSKIKIQKLVSLFWFRNISFLVLKSNF